MLLKQSKKGAIFDLLNFSTFGKIVQVYDGDTCMINIIMP